MSGATVDREPPARDGSAAGVPDGGRDGTAAAPVSHTDSGVLAVLDARGVGRPRSARRPVSRPLPRTWFLRTG